MAKKREKIKRRREVMRARRGLRAEREARSVRRPASRPPEEKASARDLWIAGGVIVLVIIALVILYQVSVKRPLQKAQPVLLPSPGITLVATPEGTLSPTPQQQP